MKRILLVLGLLLASITGVNAQTITVSWAGGCGTKTYTRNPSADVTDNGVVRYTYVAGPQDYIKWENGAWKIHGTYDIVIGYSFPVVHTSSDFATFPNPPGISGNWDFGSDSHSCRAPSSFTGDISLILSAAATELTSNSAKLTGTIGQEPGITIAQRGFIYGTSSDPTASNSSNVGVESTDWTFSTTINNLTSGSTYYYRSYAVRGVDTTFSPVLSFTAPPKLNSNPEDLTVTSGLNASFAVNATSGNPISYQWQVSGIEGVWENVSNGNVYSGASSATLTVTNAPISMNGYKYRVIVSNGGSVISDHAILTVIMPPFITQGKDWQALSSETVATRVDRMSVSVDPNGIVYVAYQDSISNTLSVKKLVGDVWQAVGDAGALAGRVKNPLIGFDAQGKPQVAFQVDQELAILKVIKFNGESWINIGEDEDVSQVITYPHKMFDDLGNLYVVHRDYFNEFRPLVKKFSGTEWEFLGYVGSSSENNNYTLAFGHGGTPYVAIPRGNLVNVLKFNGNSWDPVVLVYPPPISNPFSLAVDSNEVPYLAYKNSTGDGIIVIRYRNGQWEVVGDPIITQSSPGNPGIYLDAAGTPFVSFTAGPRFETLVFKLGVTGWSPLMNMDGPSYSRGSAMLVRNPSDIPYLAYISETAGSPTLEKFAVLPPTITTQPAGNSITAGANTSFSVTATANGSLSYQWQVSNDNGATFSNISNGSGYSGATSATLSLTNVPVSQNGNKYRVKVSNGTVTTSGIVDLTVQTPGLDVTNKSWLHAGLKVEVPAADGTPDPVRYPVMRLAPDGTPHLAYSDETLRGSIRLFKLNGIDWEHMGMTDSSRSVSSLSMAFDPSGKNQLVYTGELTDRAFLLNYNGRSVVSREHNGYKVDAGTPTMVEVGPDAIPYIVQSENSKVYVKRFVGGNWVNVGDYLAVSTNNFSLTLDAKGLPYVAYFAENLLGFSVAKFDGIIWDLVGGMGFEAGDGRYVKVKVDSFGNPYLLTSGPAGTFVMKPNGEPWIRVGESFEQGNEAQLALDGKGVPYVAYISQSSRVVVRRFNGSTWEIVGSSAAMPVATGSLSFDIDAQGTPYVAYLSGKQPVIMRFFHNAPTIATQPEDREIVAGKSTAFSVGVSGNTSGITYQWQRSNDGLNWIHLTDQAVYSGTKTSELTIKNAQLSMNRSLYRVIVSNGSLDSSRAVLLKVSLTEPASERYAWRELPGYSIQHPLRNISLDFDSNGRPHVLSTKTDNTGLTLHKLEGVNWHISASTELGTGLALDPSFVINKDDRPFVAYHQPDQQAIVMQNIGTGWNRRNVSGFPNFKVDNISITSNAAGSPLIAVNDENIGLRVLYGSGPGWDSDEWLSVDSADHLSIALDNRDWHYVAYRDLSTRKLGVSQFDGEKWWSLGLKSGISDEEITEVTLKLDAARTPYVSFLRQDGRPVVMRYNGRVWEVLGGSAGMDQPIQYLSMELDRLGVPHVAYIDGANKVGVQKFDGTHWISVGSGAIFDSFASSPYLKFDQAGILHIAFATQTGFSVLRLVRQQPEIIASGPIGAVNTVYGSHPPTPASFTVRASDLLGPVTVTAPPGYQISQKVDSEYNATIVLNGDQAGVLQASTVYIRLAAGASVAGSPYSGDVMVSSPDATTRTLATTPSTVSKKEVQITGISIADKDYDQSKTATINGAVVLNGVLQRDANNIELVDNNAGAEFLNAAAGQDKPVTVSGYSLSGPASREYTLVQPTGLKAAIRPKSITASLQDPLSKVYDGNNTLKLSGSHFTLSGLKLNDDVFVDQATATYDNSKVGTSKSVQTSGIILGGADATNYTLSAPYPASTNGVIHPKPITAGVNASELSKVYDGTTSLSTSSTNFVLHGVIAGENVTVGVKVTFDSPEVKASKSILAQNFILYGEHKDNYKLQTTTVLGNGASITPAVLKVTADNKSRLEGADNPELTISYSGFVNGEDQSVLAQVPTATTTATSSSPAGVYPIMVTGGSATNYTIQGVNGSLTVVPAPKTKANITWAASKTVTYGSGDIDPGASSNNPASPIIYSSTDPSVAEIVNNKVRIRKVGVVTITASQSGAGNFLEADRQSQLLIVEPKALTLSLTGSPVITKVYDGTRTASLFDSNYLLTGLVGGQEVKVSGEASYDNPNAGTGKVVTASNLKLYGADKDNYTLAVNSVSTTGSVTPRPLTITADDKSRRQYEADPEFSFSYSGFVNGEGPQALSSLPTASTNAGRNAVAGTYPIIASGGSSNNYELSYVNGILTVLPGGPTALNLDVHGVWENDPAGTRAGTLSAEPAGQGTYTFSLVAGDGDADNSRFRISGNQILTTQALNFEERQRYSVRIKVSDQNGLSTENSFLISIGDRNEEPTFSAIANSSICYTTSRQSISLSGITAGPEAGQTTTVNVTSSKPSMFRSLSVSQADASGNATLSYELQEGAFGNVIITVGVEDDGGIANGGRNATSRNFSLQVNALPEISISSDKGNELSKGETAVLSAKVTGGSGGLTYTWATANGILSGSNSPDLTIRPSETTTYQITVSNANGCISTQSIRIDVAGDFEVVTGTNLMSPNGDGVNDNFVIRNIDMYPNNTLKIFDKAGRLIYSKKGYANDWAGTFNGSPVAEGTYYYILEFAPGEPRRKGFISILRD